MVVKISDGEFTIFFFVFACVSELGMREAVTTE